MKKLIVLFLLMLSCQVWANGHTRPNIIFIMTDDQSAIPIEAVSAPQSRPFGFNGDQHVHTPIIDGLAAQGMIFNRAYVSSSVCSPSRYTILTGRYAGRCEGSSFMSQHPLGQMTRVENNTELEEDKANLPRMLQNAGYRTGFVGKSHVIDHHLLNGPKNGREGFKTYDKTANPNNPEVSAKMAYNHNRWVDRIKEFGFDYANGIYAANLLELNNDSLNVHNVEWKNKAALEFIDQSGDEPFFLYYSETIPHGPAPWNKKDGKYWRGLDANPGFTSAGYVEPNYDYLPARKDIIAEVRAAGKEERHAWLTWFDYAVGAVVDKLKEKGKLENTLIVLTSDHGCYNQAKSTIYEGGVKVPLMMYWPTGIQAGSTYDELVQNIDYTPTFLDLAGVNLDTAEEMDGVSLKNILNGATSDPIHDYLFFELGYARGVMNKDWKFITVRYDEATETKIESGDTFNGFQGETLDAPYYTRNGHLGHYAALNNPLYFDRNQLFDLQNDPTETVNLFDDHASKAEEMKSLLIKSLNTFPQRPYAEFSGLSSSVSKNYSRSGINIHSANGIIYIQASSEVLPVTFELFDLTGQLKIHQKIQSEQTTISVDHLTAGIYIYRCCGEAGTVDAGKVMVD